MMVSSLNIRTQDGRLKEQDPVLRRTTQGDLASTTLLLPMLTERGQNY